MTKELRELKFAAKVFDDLKYISDISIRQLIQMDLDAREQSIQLLSPDEELVRLSSTDEKTPNIDTVKNCKLITQKI